MENDRRVHILKSDLCAIISQGTLDGSEKALARDPRGADDLETDLEKQCNIPSAACSIGAFGLYLGLAWPSLIYEFLSRGRTQFTL